MNDAKVARARAVAPDAEALQRIADRFGSLADAVDAEEARR